VDWWQRAVVERREDLLWRLGDGWERRVLEPRDRALARLSDAWERTVRQPRERAVERVADAWQRVVLNLRDRAVQRVSGLWTHAVRYPGQRAGGEVTGRRERGVSVWVAVLLVVTATAVGSVIAVESGHVAEPSAGSSSARREMRPDAFAARLPAVVRVLASERSKARRRLTASRTARGQASAAETAAAAYRTSAMKLSPSAAPRDRARAATMRALRRAAVAYETLARAAEARDARSFSAARGGIERAERTVRRALGEVTAGQS